MLCFIWTPSVKSTLRHSNRNCRTTELQYKYLTRHRQLEQPVQNLLLDVADPRRKRDRQNIKRDAESSADRDNIKRDEGFEERVLFERFMAHALSLSQKKFPENETVNQEIGRASWFASFSAPCRFVSFSGYFLADSRAESLPPIPRDTGSQYGHPRVGSEVEGSGIYPLDFFIHFRSIFDWRTPGSDLTSTKIFYGSSVLSIPKFATCRLGAKE